MEQEAADELGIGVIENLEMVWAPGMASKETNPKHLKINYTRNYPFHL
jgi:hypothetical protein